MTICSSNPAMAQAAPASRSATHLPILDGVRGIAILLILGHHFLAPIGTLAFRTSFADSLWIGVDLFFVLSGFLITRILLAARNQPHYFRNFYLRRALRIFPLYYAFLAALFIAALLNPAINLHGAITGGLPSAAAYATNILIAIRGEFLTPLINPLWSLAIEEHFYLLWPLLVFLLPRRWLIGACLILIVGPLAWRLSMASNLPAGTLHTLTPFRMDTLAAGALVAVYLERGAPSAAAARIITFLFFSSALALAALWVHSRGLHWENAATQSILYTLLALFFASFLALILQPQSAPAVQRLLTHPALRFFGSYSYSLYLVNVPALLLAGMAIDHSSIASSPLAPLLQSMLALALSIGLSLATWHLLEKHCLKLKQRFA